MSCYKFQVLSFRNGEPSPALAGAEGTTKN